MGQAGGSVVQIRRGKMLDFKLILFSSFNFSVFVKTLETPVLPGVLTDVEAELLIAEMKTARGFSRASTSF